MNLSESAEMRNKEYRHGLVNAQIEVDLPLQIRALRKQLVGTQPELSRLTGMKQPRISAMEKPGGAHFTLETLRRLAEAFDVALIVRFAPFSELLDWSGTFNPDTFRIPGFAEEVEVKQTEPKEPKEALAAASTQSVAPTTMSTLGDLIKRAETYPWGNYIHQAMFFDSKLPAGAGGTLALVGGPIGDQHAVASTAASGAMTAPLPQSAVGTPPESQIHLVKQHPEQTGMNEGCLRKRSHYRRRRGRSERRALASLKRTA
jgi:transcriptional regulator with XRE-family HTH domain